jgi:hypothetical protein
MTSVEKRVPRARAAAATASTCTAHSCGAEDPVSEPDYNMRQVIKQSILLEEHLTQTKKRCRDCQIKHFLHIEGLVEEAMMLSGQTLDRYPLIKESYEFYSEVFEKWLKHPTDDEVLMQIASKLRDWRKQLAGAYYP